MLTLYEIVYYFLLQKYKHVKPFQERKTNFHCIEIDISFKYYIAFISRDMGVRQISLQTLADIIVSRHNNHKLLFFVR